VGEVVAFALGWGIYCERFSHKKNFDDISSKFLKNPQID
jgi:hypothetical protein